MAISTEIVSAAVPSELRATLVRMAAADERSLSSLVRIAVREYVERAGSVSADRTAARVEENER